MLENLKKPKTVLSCKVQTLIETLPEEDSKILAEAIKDQEWKAFQLANELRKFDINISDRTIRHHRLGNCSCSKI